MRPISSSSTSILPLNAASLDCFASSPRILFRVFYAWRERDEEADFWILQARNLLFEFVGGEPGAQLRDQFA